MASGRAMPADVVSAMESDVGYPEVTKRRIVWQSVESNMRFQLIFMVTMTQMCAYGQVTSVDKMLTAL